MLKSCWIVKSTPWERSVDLFTYENLALDFKKHGSFPLIYVNTLTTKVACKKLVRNSETKLTMISNGAYLAILERLEIIM